MLLSFLNNRSLRGETHAHQRVAGHGGRNTRGLPAPQPGTKKPEEIPLGALPEEVAKVLRAAHFAVDQALQEVEKHGASKANGSHTRESCAKHREIVLDFIERLTDLRKHAGETLRAHFNLTSTDEFGIRAEGVVLIPPTPPDPLEVMVTELRRRGIPVEILRAR